MIKYLISTLILLSGLVEAATYYTRPGIEVDKCASCWLIKKFVDKNAVFLIVPADSTISNAIPFDIPEAEFSRKQGKTTFDTILEKYKITDAALTLIAGVIKDAEINIWAKKKNEETPGIQRIIRGLELIANNDLKCIQSSYLVFDALYQYYLEEIKK
jgi:hypothetical protein